MANYNLAFPLFGLLLMAASCSQEDLGNRQKYAPGDRIEFRTSMPEISTRALEATGDNINEFQVSSFIEKADGPLTPYFLDKSFEKNASEGKFFSLDPECVWPNITDTLRFVAFAPSCDKMRTNGGFNSEDFSLTGKEDFSTAYKLSNFKVAKDIASQVDFVAANGKGNLEDNDDEPIKLDFQHLLSRININAWGASPNFNIEIAGVRLGGVGVEGDFNFNLAAKDENSSAGNWASSIGKGTVEYIYREGDTLVVLDKSENSPKEATKAVSIMGSKVNDSHDNSAMLLPSNYTEWKYKENAANGENNCEGMYFSVLMRVTDDTSYAPGSLLYPYADTTEEMEVIYLAVDKADGKTVKIRVYSNNGKYYTDEKFTTEYDLEGNGAEVKAFGWAALPAKYNWLAGTEYTYTLNYTGGVGLRQPTDSQPGEPIISDRVLVDVTVKTWAVAEPSGVDVPRR